MADEKTVLHVGPVDTRGGMATVIRILCENPPEGWRTDTLATHTEGSIVSKFLYWRKARRQLIDRLKQAPPDLVHIHTASDYSWWRKRRVALICNKANVPVIMHIHSGRFLKFCEEKSGKDVKKICQMKNLSVVTLSQSWHENLKKWIGESMIIHNPVDLSLKMDNVERKKNQILFMGRDSPSKNIALVIDIIEMARKSNPELQLFIGGISADSPLAKMHSDKEWFFPLGWVDDEKKQKLLNESTMLLIPSEVECQPMVVLEALASGLPVIGSQAVAETLSEAGLILPSLDLQLWSESLLKMLENKKLEEFSKAGLELSKSYSIEVIQSRWGIQYSKAI